MAKHLEIYKCEKCGNVVEVLQGGAGSLVCCEEEMKLFEEKTADSSTEKHVPLVEKTANGYKVTVGSTLHPMKDDHWIQWIELIADGSAYRKFLDPGDDPVAEFCISAGATDVYAREYCNLHGLWKGV